MQVKEEKICSFTQNGTRLQLLKVTTKEVYNKNELINLERYTVRLNRKVQRSSISEYQMRKLFAVYAQNIVLQLKIY